MAKLKTRGRLLELEGRPKMERKVKLCNCFTPLHIATVFLMKIEKRDEDRRSLGDATMERRKNKGRNGFKAKMVYVK